MNAKTFSWVALAVIAACTASFACGPDKPPLTPDALDPDAGAVPEVPPPSATTTAPPSPG